MSAFLFILALSCFPLPDRPCCPFGQVPVVDEHGATVGCESTSPPSEHSRGESASPS